MRSSIARSFTVIETPPRPTPAADPIGAGRYPAIPRQDIMAALRTNEWFRGLPEKVVAEIVALAVPRRYAGGELVHGKSEPAANLYGIVSGGVRISSTAPDGRESVFSFMGPGDWFGHIGLLDGLPRTHDIRACQETILVIIRHADFNRLLDENLILYKHFAQLLCKLVRTAFANLEDETLLSLQARFAKRLLALADTYGVAHEDGVLINLHLPQQDLAAILNVARQTVNKKLVEWQHLNWIRMHYGQIIITNRRALEQLFNES